MEIEGAPSLEVRATSTIAYLKAGWSAFTDRDAFREHLSKKSLGRVKAERELVELVYLKNCLTDTLTGYEFDHVKALMNQLEEFYTLIATGVSLFGGLGAEVTFGVRVTPTRPIGLFCIIKHIHHVGFIVRVKLSGLNETPNFTEDSFKNLIEELKPNGNWFNYHEATLAGIVAEHKCILDREAAEKEFVRQQLDADWSSRMPYQSLESFYLDSGLIGSVDLRVSYDPICVTVNGPETDDTTEMF